MKRRVSSLIFAAAFLAATAAIGTRPASADPPPWSAAYHKHNGDHCNHPSHSRNNDYDRRGRYDQRGRYLRAYESPQCQAIIDRAAKARAGLARWGRTRNHQDAQQAWREILARTPQRLSECRRQAQYNDDPNRYGSYDGYDPYDNYDGYSDGGIYGSGNTSFEIKRDWPYLLGGLLGQYQSGR